MLHSSPYDGLGQDLSQEIGLVITDNTFVMPSMNVKVQGIFEKIDANGKTNEYTATDGNIEGKITFTNEIPDNYTLDIRTSQTPEHLKKDGVASLIFSISLMHNNQPVPVSDNPMTVTIALPEELIGKEMYYRQKNIC